MKTIFEQPFHKKFCFLILSLFCFSLLSFNTNSTESNSKENNATMEQQMTIIITKKTTLEELEAIKKQMTDAGLGFNYSNVVYNDKNEIIAISIFYKDLNNNSGNYSVSSQNPINNIVIVSEGSRISVKSEGSSNQAFINQGSGDQSSAMKERREQMEKEMEERMKAMNERQDERKKRMQQQRDSIRKQNQSHAKSITGFNGNSQLITKNTTNSELLEIQNSYDTKNISFYYKNLERNDNNEITHISITIDTRNGSVSTSGFGNGKEAIKNITLAVDKQHTIMKSAE